MTKIIPDQTLNLEGITCPNNFVRAKLKLEEMECGRILEIILDAGEPVKNVPRAIKEDGHEIVKVEKRDTVFSLLVRKTGN